MKHHFKLSIMKELIKRIRSYFCKHREVEISLVTKRKCKLKKGTKEAKTLYDVYEVTECAKCGKLINRRRVKYNLTGRELLAYNQWLKSNRGR